jgi:hypothetical protein
MVVDGVAQRPFENIDAASVTFSPDGRRVAYVAEDGPCLRAVVDAESGGCRGRVVGLALGNAPERDVTVVAEADGSDARVLRGDETIFRLPYASELAVDRNVDHWAVVSDSANGPRVVADGQEQESFDAIDRMVWAPEGSEVAYAARRRQAWYVVTGGRRSEPYADVEEPVFAPSRSHHGYLAHDAGGSVVAIDDRIVWRSPAHATGLTPNDDGSRWGWAYRDGEKAGIAVDGERFPFEVVIERTLRFSHDGRHWAALVGSLRERRLFLVVDGGTTLSFDSEEFFGGPRDDPAGRLRGWVSAELERHLVRARARRP